MSLRPLHAAAVAGMGAALIGGVLAYAPASEAAPADPGGPNDPFVACMTENGVPAPPQGGPRGPGGPGGQDHPNGPPPSGAPQQGQGGPPPAPPGVDEGVWNKAFDACASLAPAPPQH